MNTVGWSSAVADQGFGGANAADASIKSKLVNLVTSVRTLMRSTYPDVAHRRGSEGLTRMIVPLIAINVIIILYELILG